jgi:hypothetical protein
MVPPIANEDDGLKRLSVLLRNKETWPPRFKWNYRLADSCAVPLAAKVLDWNLTYSSIPQSVRATIFTDLGNKLNVRMGRVEPEDVAKAIDIYMAEGVASILSSNLGSRIRPETKWSWRRLFGG